MNTAVDAPAAAPKWRSARAAALASCSSTTGSSSRADIRSATGASRQARCGANRTVRRSGVMNPASASPTASTRCRAVSSVITPASAASSATTLRGVGALAVSCTVAEPVDHAGPHAGAPDVHPDGQHDAPAAPGSG